MLLTHVFLVLSLAISAWGYPSPAPHVRHESRHALPDGWTPIRRALHSTVLPLRIGLAQPNLAEIESLLLDISHPDSPNYGNHWSAAKVAETFRPSQEAIDAVYEWLASGGINASRIKLSKSHGWIEANTTVVEAENLLKTEYHVYRHFPSGAEHIACNMEYHLPEHVAQHVELVTPTLHFDITIGESTGNLQKRSIRPESGAKLGPSSLGSLTTGSLQSIADDLENCDQRITPACLRALYKFTYVPVATHKNSIGIVEYTPNVYVPSDLDMFFTNFSASQVGERPQLVSIDGGAIQGAQSSFNDNGESNLDLQYAMSLVGKSQPVTLYQAGDFVEGASFNNLLDALDGSFCTFEGGDDPSQDSVYPDTAPGGFQGPEDCGTTKPAFIISTSYSYNEVDLTPAYTARQCAEYAKLGLMGVTVLYSSGDTGVAGRGNLCLFPNGTQSTSGKIFSPKFPSTCPFITSVGATQVSPGAKVTDPESACEQVIFSGGGFSNHFAMPEYQKSTVESFLAKFPPPYPKSIWNATGSRAYPDIAANGANFVVAVDGEFELVFGTSASTPVSAAIFSAVNDARLAIGKKSIGFLNPTIYASSFKGVFNDITNGTNQGCGTQGFTAVPGWDPVTGFGTPNFPKLLQKFLLLP
ncbi:hypothetical protein EW026_g5491 [Hermanssonia centrifuga]|uniref:tripeptidyl-peptidase II n=1 Tax=Hermanssonia centrifuga TaxID=98765 RepID=A0A4S4KIB2_9APHY|nr:hypothetical protein EW026_g5491 [Hermanssonia centrifuga]